MKHTKILLLVMVLSASTFSQNMTAGFSWSMGFTSGKTADYVGTPSFSGFSLETHKFLKPNVSVGITSGWNILNEKNNETINIGNTAISGEQGRYINVVPILLNASYYLKTSKTAKFVPFIRANVGTYYILQRFDIGVYTVNNYNWHLGVAPELGFMIQVNKEIGILTNAKYNYAFDAGTRLGGDEMNDYSFFTLNLGISYNY